MRNAPTQAAIYLVDLNTLSPVRVLGGPSYCGTGPHFPFLQFQPGDVVDFGQVQIFSVYDGHSADRVDPNGFFPPEIFTYQSTVAVTFDPSVFPWQPGSLTVDASSRRRFA